MCRQHPCSRWCKLAVRQRAPAPPLAVVAPFTKAARDARSVVTADSHCAVADIGGIRHDIQVADDASLLQVAVGDVAFQVFDGDEALLCFRQERRAPHTWRSVCVEENAAHALACGVRCAHNFGLVGSDLCEVGRPVAQVGMTVVQDALERSSAVATRNQAITSSALAFTAGSVSAKPGAMNFW